MLLASAETALSSSSQNQALSRQLSWIQIAGYDPGSNVEDHNALDLDQKDLEAYLGEKPPNYAAAKKIYTKGGHSGCKAVFTVPALGSALAKGDTVTQAGNEKAIGYVKSATDAGATELTVAYKSICKSTDSGVKETDTTGCFNAEGALMAKEVNIGTPSAMGLSCRTLQGFSLQAEKKMTGQPHFEDYKSYYGAPDYGDKYVTAALDGTGVWAGLPDEARVQGVKKGTVYMNVFMYVIREFEDAMDDCNAGCIDCNEAPGVHAWDEGVAFYTGTLEGTEFSPGQGKMLYALADKRCKNFATCGKATAEAKDRLAGTSEVNEALFKLFRIGQNKLQKAECDVRKEIDQIVSLMTVPQLQGTLRYAYKVGELNEGAKSAAEGAVFAGAILPRVHKCDADAAKLVAANLNADVEKPMGANGFKAVKEALESTYACLGITCAHVGGLVLNGDTFYHSGAEPCTAEAGGAKGGAADAADKDGGTAPAPAPAPAPDTAADATANASGVVPASLMTVAGLLLSLAASIYS